MKFANLVFGLVLFSVVITLLFTAARDMTEEYGSSNADAFVTLAGKYDFTSNLTTEANSTIRSMSGQTELGAASSEEKDVFFLSGAVSAVRLIINIVPTTQTIIETSYGDTGNFIPRIIIDAIIGLVIVFIVLVSIHMFMRMRSEV